MIWTYDCKPMMGPMISNLWCGPMIWTYDRWFWRSAAGCHCGDEICRRLQTSVFTFNLKVWVEMRHQIWTCNVDLKFQLAIWCDVLISKFNFKFEFQRTTSIFNLKCQCEVLILKFNFKFELKRSISIFWIWNFNVKSWLEAFIWNFNLQFQFAFLVLDLRLVIWSKYLSVRTKFVCTCEIEKIIIRAEIVRTKFVRTHVVHNVVQKRFALLSPSHSTSNFSAWPGCFRSLPRACAPNFDAI